MIESAFVAVRPAPSVASTLKALIPAEVGLPEMTPVEALRASPAARAPDVIDQVYVPAPPDAASVLE